MKTLILTALAAIALSSGCAGGRSNLRFDDTRYPVSLSPTVLGSDGMVLVPARREIVGKLEIETKVYGLLWAAVPLTPNKNLSDQVNDQIERAGGQAVVNLRVTSRQCGLNSAWVLSTVPLWPGCSRVFVQGEIIRERPAELVPAPQAEPTTDAQASLAHPMAVPAGFRSAP
ncbi:MAG: hypothetical protein K1X88_26010 [Nannocystaceae bacterium]|nr:hypothetical protein [Nannocystaceae bacterium]